MSLATLTLRNIDRSGRDFLVEGSDQSVKGNLADDQATFAPDCGIQPGQLLKDTITGWEYITADVRRSAIEIKAALLRFGHRCCIYRNIDSELDAFHRSGDILEATAVNVPVAFRDQEHAALPADTDIRPGDLLSVPAIGESWRVKGIATAAPPGVCSVALAKQSGNVTAAAAS